MRREQSVEEQVIGGFVGELLELCPAGFAHHDCPSPYEAILVNRQLLLDSKIGPDRKRAMLEIDDAPGCAGPNRWILLQCFRQDLDVGAGKRHIGVEEKPRKSLGRRIPDIESTSLTRLGEVYHPYAGPVGLRGRCVATAVGHDRDVEAFPARCTQRVEAPADDVFLVVRGDDDGYHDPSPPSVLSITVESTPAGSPRAPGSAARADRTGHGIRALTVYAAHWRADLDGDAYFALPHRENTHHRWADLVQVGRFLHTKLMRGYQRRTGQLASSRRGRIPSGVSGQDMAICFRIAMRSWVSSWYSRAVVTSAAGRWLFATSVRCACCPPTEHSVRLLRAAWGDRTSHLTDLSPSGAVVPMNERFGFTRLDTTTALVPALPVLPQAARARVVDEPGAITGRLRGRDLEVFRDHQHARAAHHVVLQRGSQSCYVIWRRDRRKNLPLFASFCTQTIRRR